MNEKSFDELKALAESIYSRARDMDRDHAVIFILENLAKVYGDGKMEMLETVEARLAMPRQ